MKGFLIPIIGSILILGLLSFDQNAFAHDQTFSVNCDGGACPDSYSINGVEDPNLFLERGSTYTFNVLAPNHPFAIHQTSGDISEADRYNDGVSGQGNQVGAVTFIVPNDAPDTLYYVCELHPWMTGTLNIIDSDLSQVELTVKSELLDGTPITQKYTDLFQNGIRLGDGFTPAIYLLNSGETYRVKAHNFENYEFAFWKDTDSTDRRRDIAIDSDRMIVAVYRDTSLPPPTVTIHSTLGFGFTEIFGYYAVLSQGGIFQDANFTPASFSVNPGETYNAGVQNYGDFKFVKWMDTNSPIPDRDFSIVVDTDYYAQYRDINDPAPPGKNKITVRTQNSSGEEISGYWTTLSQDGGILQVAFSPESFIVNNGETYEVFVSEFGGVTFGGWSDGNTDNPRSFLVTSDITATAILVPLAP